MAMKATKITLTSTILAAALGLALGLMSAPPAEAHHRDGHTKAGGAGGGGSASDCQLSFNVMISSSGVASDGGDYEDKVDKVKAITGSGPGFSLDTNGGSQKLEGAGGTRTVCINDYYGSNDACSGVDLRFDRSQGGLDLCALAIDETKYVGLSIEFVGLGGEERRLSYGCFDTDGSVVGISSPVEVTRIGPSTWEIDGTIACLRDRNIFSFPEIIGDDLDIPLSMTLTDQAS